MASGLQKNYLEFVFDIDNIQFNHIGRYFLKLSVQSSYVLLSNRTDIYNKIRIRKNDDDYYAFGHEAATDTIEQYELNKSYTFADNKFSFFLPKGKLIFFFNGAKRKYVILCYRFKKISFILLSFYTCIHVYECKIFVVFEVVLISNTQLINIFVNLISWHVPL